MNKERLHQMKLKLKEIAVDFGLPNDRMEYLKLLELVYRFGFLAGSEHMIEETVKKMKGEN